MKKLSKSKKSARALDKKLASAPRHRLTEEDFMKSAREIKTAAHRTDLIDWKLAEQVLLQGDLGKLSNEEQTKYVLGLCRSLGLNPLTKPFMWLLIDGKLTLYASRNATDQLRAIHHVDIRPVSSGALQVGGQQFLDVYVVTVHAVMPNGRQDTGTGAVSIRGISGVDLANAVMRAETKAKRRATLSICGLSFLDESELDTVRFQMPERSEEVRRVAPPAALQHAPVVTSSGYGRYVYADTYQAAGDAADIATVAVPGATAPVIRAPGMIEFPPGPPVEKFSIGDLRTVDPVNPAPSAPIAASTPVQQ